MRNINKHDHTENEMAGMRNHTKWTPRHIYTERGDEGTGNIQNDRKKKCLKCCTSVKSTRNEKDI